MSQHVFKVLRAATDAFEEACACANDGANLPGVKREESSEGQTHLAARLVQAARMIFELYRSVKVKGHL